MNSYSYLSTRRRLARAYSHLDIQARIPREDPRREAEIKKLTDAELGVDMFTQELKMMAVSWYPLCFNDNKIDKVIDHPGVL